MEQGLCLGRGAFKPARKHSTEHSTCEMTPASGLDRVGPGCRLFSAHIGGASEFFHLPWHLSNPVSHQIHHVQNMLCFIGILPQSASYNSLPCCAEGKPKVQGPPRSPEQQGRAQIGRREFCPPVLDETP